jgi:hypothetical protein
MNVSWKSQKYPKSIAFCENREFMCKLRVKKVKSES